MPTKEELLNQIEALKSENKQLLDYKERICFIESISQEAIAVFGEDNRCIDITKRSSDIFGYTKEEAMGMTGVDFTAEVSHEVVARHVKENSLEPYEAVLKKKDGSTFWGRVHARIVEYNGKNYRVVTCRDISEQKALQKKTLDVNAEYETIFDNSQVGILLLSKDRVIIRANHKIAEIFGYESGNDFIGESVEKFHLSKENFEEFGKFYRTTLLEGKVAKDEYQFKNAQGKPIWISVSGRAIDHGCTPSLEKGVVWVFEDIEEKRKAEARLKEAHAELELIFENTMMGIMLLKSGREIYRVNQVMAHMFGYDSADELIGKSTKELHLSSKSFDDFGKRFYTALKNQEVNAVDFKFKKKDGSPLWVAISGKAIDTNRPANLDLGVIWSTMDITKRKSTEEKLIELSRMDALTKIYNRRYFYELAGLELDIHKRYKRPFSILNIDIDYFKRINDTYGHAVGDRTLAFFAKVCKGIIRSTDIFGRVGGEEFAICLLEVELEQAALIAEKIRKKLAKILPDAFEGIPVMTISVGVVTVEKFEDIEAAMKRSDELLYKAKSNGRDCVLVN